MKITFLGTGAGIPAKYRNVSSLALQLMNKEGTIWLFDCGEATQHQILHTPIKLRKINKIFITHLHGDHIYGLPGLLGSRSFQGATSPLTIYGPKGIKQFVETSLKVSETYLRYPLSIIEMNNEEVLFEDEQYVITTAPLIHGLPSFGFRLQEKDLPGALLADKLKKENIPPGPIYKEIKKGKTVSLSDGRLIHGKDYIGPPQKGHAVAILGDTRYTEKAIQLAKNVDTLVHESTFAKKEEEIAFEYFHSSTTQAAEVAKLANAKQLLLNHISSRYQEEDMEQLLREARNIFPNTYIAYDLSTFNVPRKE